MVTILTILMVSEQIFSREDAHSPATIAMHQEKFSSEVCSNILEHTVQSNIRDAISDNMLT